MRNYDLSPLYRSAVGFDRMVNLINAANSRDSGQSSYPPYNIESLDDDKYRISLAVAGFSLNEISIEVEQNSLTVNGSQAETKNIGTYLHQGIAARNFERKFQLDDYIKVVDAKAENGLLHINLVREIPEAMKPRTIKIQSVSSPTLEQVNEHDNVNEKNAA